MGGHAQTLLLRSAVASCNDMSFSIKRLRRDARKCIDIPTCTARYKLDVYGSKMLCVYLREIGRFSPEPSRSRSAGPQHDSESVICRKRTFDSGDHAATWG
jgi:hypothetical protein